MSNLDNLHQASINIAVHEMAEGRITERTSEVLPGIMMPPTFCSFPGDKTTNSRHVEPGSERVESAPDGGQDAWLQVVGGFVVWMNTLGIVTSYGEFQLFYQVDRLRHRDPTSIAWIGSTHAATMFACGIIAGPLFDKGYFYHCEMVGSIFIVLGPMMTSLCHVLWQFVLAQGLYIGLQSGLVFIPMLGLITQWFDTQRGIANKLASSGSAVAGIIYPIVFKRLQKDIGFPWAVRALDFMVLATQLLAIALLRVRFKPTRVRALIDRSVKKDYAFLMLTLPIITVWAACYVPWNYLSAFAIESRITDPSLGFYIIAIMNASSVLGRLILSAIADKSVGIVNMCIVLVFVTGVLCFAWMGIHNLAGLIVFAVVIGFIGGGVLTLASLIPVCFTPDPEYIGTRLGMCMLLGGLCLLWGTPVAGSLIDESRSYTRLEIYAGVMLLSTAFLLSLTRMLRTGPEIFVKF
ncbi:major facilitator superfamily domain-containing protein [Paraphoma chrysanthemicola]|uniref:Major facilitator superfamily domain-containing protein n=1 Tax=Paraphoma chrysanthemicola TaxID=798071 RepID=A0A8K0R4Y1_9PLEO|nr:major facilitator superfamily domain-containing protein [Paraphoma chrysanthemicola]